MRVEALAAKSILFFLLKLCLERYMQFLVSTSWLEENIDDTDLKILECTVALKPGDGGFVAESMFDDWYQNHIPNSQYVDLTNDLSDPTSSLRFTMPSENRFAEVMEALGISSDSRVVLYDRRMTMWATRVWWMLKFFGFDQCAVLDGGWRTWSNEGRKISHGNEKLHAPGKFDCVLRPEMIVSTKEVEASLTGAACLVNSLSPENHDGTDLSYGTAGHIPGASNVYAVKLVDSQSHKFLPIVELKQIFSSITESKKPIITYCGGGIAATSDAFVLTALLGENDVAVYDGSLSEWLLDPARPMEV